MRYGVLIAVLVVLVAALPAAAKDGGQALLLLGIPHHRPAGSVITVRWTVKEAGTPFAASGMFVTLVGRGRSSTEVAPQKAPPYSVRIRIPAGGIRKIEVGLRGWAVTASGRHFAPVLFPVAKAGLR